MRIMWVEHSEAIRKDLELIHFVIRIIPAFARPSSAEEGNGGVRYFDRIESVSVFVKSAIGQSERSGNSFSVTSASQYAFPNQNLFNIH